MASMPNNPPRNPAPTPTPTPKSIGEDDPNTPQTEPINVDGDE